MKKLLAVSFILLLIFFFGSCASVESIDTCVSASNEAGFLHGLLHGFIAPVTFIISLFKDEVAMYAVNNSGTLYDLGFLLGIGGFSGGIFKSSKKNR